MPVCAEPDQFLAADLTPFQFPELLPCCVNAMFGAPGEHQILAQNNFSKFGAICRPAGMAHQFILMFGWAADAAPSLSNSPLITVTLSARLFGK